MIYTQTSWSTCNATYLDEHAYILLPSSKTLPMLLYSMLTTGTGLVPDEGNITTYVLGWMVNAAHRLPVLMDCWSMKLAGIRIDVFKRSFSFLGK